MKLIRVSLLVLVLVFLTSGCAAQVTSSTPGTVVVRASVPDTGVEKALELAEAECAKRNLSARVRSVTSPTTDRYIFDCI